MKNYRINVKTLEGNILVFNVRNYRIIDGVFIEFFDDKKDQYKIFPASNCEITWNRVGDTDAEN